MQSAVKAYRRSQRDQLILDHLEYVQHVIHRLIGRLPDGVDIENLHQAGVYGLVEAAEQFDAGRGAAFTTFAYKRISGIVIDELRRNSPLSQEQMRRAGLIQQALDVLPPPVDPEQLARQTGLSLEEVESTLEAQRLANAGFLDEDILPSIGDDSVDSPDLHVLRKEQKEQLAAGIEQLAEQQRIVLTMYYLEDMRLKEIGQVMDLSESRISRVLSQAEFRLREFIRSQE